MLKNLLYLLSFVRIASADTSVKTDVLTLRPSTIPASCVGGELRRDTATGNLKYCSATTYVTSLVAGGVSLTADVTGVLPIANGGTSGATKAAAFDALSPMTTSGDVIYGGTAGTGTRLAKGTDGQVLKLSSGLPAWSTDSTGSGVAAYRAVATTDSTTASDTIVNLSGASFTLTLHTAVGNTGQILEIHHSGTSISQVYTLATTSAQTIGGIASGVYALYTNGEVLKLVSNGANWLISDHKTNSALSSTATITFSTGTKGTTSVDETLWRRAGSFAEIYYRYRQTTAGTTGAGDYLITLPGSLVADTTEATAYSGTLASSFSEVAAQEAILEGNGHISNGTNKGRLTALLYSTTQIRIMTEVVYSAYSSPMGSTIYPLNNTDLAFTLRFRVRIAGWQP